LLLLLFCRSRKSPSKAKHCTSQLFTRPVRNIVSASFLPLPIPGGVVALSQSITVECFFDSCLDIAFLTHCPPVFFFPLTGFQERIPDETCTLSPVGGAGISNWKIILPDRGLYVPPPLDFFNCRQRPLTVSFPVKLATASPDEHMLVPQPRTDSASLFLFFFASRLMFSMCRCQFWAPTKSPLIAFLGVTIQI